MTTKKRLFLTLAASLAAQLLTAQTSLFETDRVVATVDDKVFTSMDVRQAVVGELERINASLTGQARADQVTRVCRLALDAMVNKELIYLDFKDLKAKLPNSLVQERIDSAVTANAGGDIILFEEKLYQEGLTMAEYRERVHKDIAVEMLMRNKVKTGVSIADDEVERFYAEHRFDMTTPMRYRLAVILLKGDGRHAGRLPEAIAEIQAKLKSGVPFADLAKEYSEGAAADQGGDQGWLESLNDAIRLAIRDLNKGDATRQPVTIGSNVYFVRVLDIAGGGVPPLDQELKAKIKDRLTRLEEERRYQDYLRELHGKFAVRRLDGLN